LEEGAVRELTEECGIGSLLSLQKGLQQVQQRPGSTILLAQRQSFSGLLLGNGRLYLLESVIILDQQKNCR